MYGLDDQTDGDFDADFLAGLSPDEALEIMMGKDAVAALKSDVAAAETPDVNDPDVDITALSPEDAFAILCANDEQAMDLVSCVVRKPSRHLHALSFMVPCVHICCVCVFVVSVFVVSVFAVCVFAVLVCAPSHVKFVRLGSDGHPLTCEFSLRSCVLPPMCDRSVSAQTTKTKCQTGYSPSELCVKH